jgi:hypothetical protein
LIGAQASKLAAVDGAAGDSHRLCTEVGAYFDGLVPDHEQESGDSGGGLLGGALERKAVPLRVEQRRTVRIERGPAGPSFVADDCLAGVDVREAQDELACEPELDRPIVAFDVRTRYSLSTTTSMWIGKPQSSAGTSIGLAPTSTRWAKAAEKQQ